jgi:membrane-associated protease RseP (regulator of RpoE activity)
LWDIGIIAGLGILFTGLAVFSVNLITFFLPKTSDVTPIAVTPVIPGVTISLQTLPYFIVAIMIAALVHEFAHGIAARTEKVSLKSTGLFVFLLFFGAFVEPNEESLKQSSNRSKMRIMGAGGLANMLVVFLLLLVLIVPIGFPLLISGFYQMEPSGVLIVDTVENAPANQAGIIPGYAITGIEVDGNFFKITSAQEFHDFVNTQVRPNQTLEFHFFNEINPITLQTITHEANQSRGYIGVLTWNYYKPHLFSNVVILNLIPYWVFYTLVYTLMVNLMLALINLLPVPFLDGDKLLAAFLGEKYPELHKWIKYYSFGILALNILFSFYFVGWDQL